MRHAFDLGPGRPLRRQAVARRGRRPPAHQGRLRIADEFGTASVYWLSQEYNALTKLGISSAMAMERWAAGFKYVLDLADEPASYSRTFTAESSPCSNAAAVRVSVTRTLTHLPLTAA